MYVSATVFSNIVHIYYHHQVTSSAATDGGPIFELLLSHWTWEKVMPIYSGSNFFSSYGRFHRNAEDWSHQLIATN